MNLKNLNNQDEDVHFEKHDNFSDYGLYYQSSSNEETFFFAKVENHTLDKEYRFQHISYYHESRSHSFTRNLCFTNRYQWNNRNDKNKHGRW